MKSQTDQIVEDIISSLDSPKKSRRKESDTKYRKLQDDLFVELNKLRKNPKSYIPLITSQMRTIKYNNVLFRSDTPLRIQTFEGKNAYEDAINFLEDQIPIPPLKLDKRLCLAALDLVNDIGPKGLVTHQDSKGLFVSDRIEQYCEWDFCANECIEVSSHNAQDVLISLLVDDGLSNRMNRKALFERVYNYVGIGCGAHRDFQVCSVLVFAGALRPKGSLFYQFDAGFEERGDVLNKDVVNDYQVDDPDAPNNTVGLRVVKTQKFMGNKKVIVTKKFYLLDNGTEHVVELEEY